ncbi:invasion associated locus B family protein [Gemmobacter serpentinus]|uniref:invasion associated locus B family protein n=1 Tax=Gemmobacter serpentinus TaxID=2652247 RepID=UPI00124C7D7C|nr:invasion associated locus B family protein [Gemmobacter serpentinus]
MNSLIARTLGGAALAVIAATTGAIAQDSTNQVAVMSDWSVFTDPPTGTPKECWAVTKQKTSEATRDGKPVSASRSDILLFVTFRSGGGRGEVSYTGGYPFRNGSTVNVNIDGTAHDLFTEGEFAWTSGGDQDAQIVAALKKGSTAIVTGVSGRGTQTKDTISLRGVTAAIDDAAKRCQ